MREYNITLNQLYGSAFRISYGCVSDVCTQVCPLRLLAYMCIIAEAPNSWKFQRMLLILILFATVCTTSLLLLVLLLLLLFVLLIYFY